MSSLLRRDSIQFSVGAIFIAVIWQIFVQAPLSELYGSFDLLGLMAHYSGMLREGYLASDFIYSPGRQAGTPTGPIDMPLSFQLFAFMGAHPILAINLSIILIQSLIYFFSFKLLRWESSRAPIVLVSVWALILAFSPSLAWRVGFGHLNLLWGVLWALATVYTVQAVRHKDLTPTGIFFTAFIYANSLQCLNLAQPVYYSIICFLVFIGLFFRRYSLFSREILTPLVICSFSALLFAANNLSNIVSLAPSLARFESESVIYSYTTQTFLDFISSLFYSVDTIKVDRNPFELHETNLGYGFVPVILTILFALNPRKKVLQLNILLLTFGIILSSNIPVVSDVLLAIVPMAGKFRCPGRFFLLTNILGLLTLGYFSLRNTSSELRRWEFAPAFIALIISIPDFKLSPDIILLVGVVVVIGASVYIKKLHYASALFFLLAVHVGGFRERLPEGRLTLDQYQKEEQVFKQLNLPNSLVEHASTHIFSSFTLSQGVAYEFSAIDGYIYPSKRFSQFVRLFDIDISLGYNFHVDSNTPGFETFIRFFNITNEIRNTGSGYAKVKIQESRPVFTPQTFIAKEHITREDLEGLALEETAILEEGHPQLSRCLSSRLVSSDEKKIVISAKANEPCLIVLPLQYSDFLQARSESKSFSVIPANMVMTGVVVNQFDGEITVRAESELGYEIVLKTLSLLVLFGFIFFQMRQRKNQNSPAGQEL